MALGDFLADQSLGSWADEMDAQPLPSASGSGYSARNAQRGAGGEEGNRALNTSAWERSAGGVGGGRVPGFDRPFATREELPMPDKPPYTAHLGNLAYDVTQADIESFLSGCEVTNVRVVEDKIDHKPKGFGYVEFATVDGLKKALTLTESQFMGRNIRISIAEPPKERMEPSRDFSDWSRKGPLPDAGRQPSRGFSRGNFEGSDAGSEAGGKRPGYFQDDGKVRDFGDWSRKGPLSPTQGAAVPAREGRGNAAWGEGRGSDAGSRPPRKEFQERPVPERAPTAAEQDNKWRDRMRADPTPVASPEASTPSSPQAQAPKERPRLNLAKRTVSEAKPDAPPAPAPQSKASPFGAARPTDTAQRDREVAEKREIAIREKREADEKAKEEKAAKEAAAKQARQEEKANAPQNERRSSRQQNGPPKTNPWRQNGDQSEKNNVSILKREGDTEGQRDTPDGDANGEIVTDKETKPQEVVKEVPRDAAEGAKQTETTAESLEDEGWSTVAAKPKNSRRGGARAMAS